MNIFKNYFSNSIERLAINFLPNDPVPPVINITLLFNIVLL